MGEKDNNSAFDSSSMPEEACTVFCKYTGPFPLKNVSAVTVGEKRNIADKDMYVFAWENRWIKCIWFFFNYCIFGESGDLHSKCTHNNMYTKILTAMMLYMYIGKTKQDIYSFDNLAHAVLTSPG